LATVAALLAAQGLTQERRALRCAIRELSSERDASTLTLSFSLRRGQFATAVLREICEFAGVPELDADEH
jgi:tRNA pseudouridine13 synthase